MNLNELLELSNSDSEKLKDAPAVIEDLKHTKVMFIESNEKLEKKLQSNVMSDIEELANSHEEFNLNESEKTTIIQIGKGKIFFKFTPVPSQSRFSARYFMEIVRNEKRETFHMELIAKEKQLSSSASLGHELQRKIDDFDGKMTNISTDDIESIVRFKDHLVEIIKLNESIDEQDLKYLIMKPGGNGHALHASNNFKEVIEKVISVTPFLK